MYRLIDRLIVSALEEAPITVALTPAAILAFAFIETSIVLVSVSILHRHPAILIVALHVGIRGVDGLVGLILPRWRLAFLASRRDDWFFGSEGESGPGGGLVLVTVAQGLELVQLCGCHADGCPCIIVWGKLREITLAFLRVVRFGVLQNGLDGVPVRGAESIILALRSHPDDVWVVFPLSRVLGFLGLIHVAGLFGLPQLTVIGKHGYVFLAQRRIHAVKQIAFVALDLFLDHLGRSCVSFSISLIFVLYDAVKMLASPLQLALGLLSLEKAHHVVLTKDLLIPWRSRWSRRLFRATLRLW